MTLYNKLKVINNNILCNILLSDRDFLNVFNRNYGKYGVINSLKIGINFEAPNSLK